jgi:hypothetical protein
MMDEQKMQDEIADLKQKASEIWDSYQNALKLLLEARKEIERLKEESLCRNPTCKKTGAHRNIWCDWVVQDEIEKDKATIARLREGLQEIAGQVDLHSDTALGRSYRMVLKIARDLLAELGEK